MRLIQYGQGSGPIYNQQSTIFNYLLYRGPFLDGFSLSDSAPFEEWLLAKREYFSQQMLKALSRLAEWSIEQGQYEQAEGYARRQIELEPWHEQAYQQLMRILSLKGERVQALAQFESLRKALQARAESRAVGRIPWRVYQQIREGALQTRMKEAAITNQVPTQPLPAFTDEAIQVPFPKASLRGAVKMSWRS